MIKVVYIAGPFRGDNSWEMEENIRRAERLALQVWRLGAAAICPHSNTRFFQGAAPDSVWLDGDLAIVAKCDAVLMTPDWNRSAGARAELDFALRRNIPVFFGTPILADWLKNQWRYDASYPAVAENVPTPDANLSGLPR